jgi:hypothetical protein
VEELQSRKKKHLRSRDLQRNRQPHDHVERDVELAALDRSKVAPINPGECGERLLGESALAPSVSRELQSPVEGSMTVETLEMRSAGKPPQRACSNKMSSSGAT